MPYVILDKMPIFLSRDLEESINKIALKHKDPVWRTSSMIRGSNEATERGRLVHAELLSRFRSDRSSFLKEWAFIYLNGDDARTDIWSVLYDYCDFHGNAHLADIRDSQGRILWDFVEDNLNLPMGRTFTLNATLAPKQPWWKFWEKKHRSVVSILIDVNTVQCIRGSLLHLKIYTKHFILTCSEHIRIEPAGGTDEVC